MTTTIALLVTFLEASRRLVSLRRLCEALGKVEWDGCVRTVVWKSKLLPSQQVVKTAKCDVSHTAFERLHSSADNAAALQLLISQSHKHALYMCFYSCAIDWKPVLCFEDLHFLIVMLQRVGNLNYLKFENLWLNGWSELFLENSLSLSVWKMCCSTSSYNLEDYKTCCYRCNVLYVFMSDISISGQLYGCIS